MRHLQSNRPRQLHFEPLEDRRLLATTNESTGAARLDPPATGTAGPAADLVLENVAFVDGRGQETTTVVTGQRVNLRARYGFSDLAATDSFILRFAMDGIVLDSAVIHGAPGTNVVRTFRNGGWLASPGLHTITVTVDANNTVAEINESNNATTFSFSPLAPSLAQKFAWPVAGTQSVDWAIENYVDADPRPSSFLDYRGGPATYDGHDGIDFAVANYAAMDRGLAVYAAADGTVLDADDGHFDRWLDFVNPEPPSNFVIIDHGSGWQTIYFHLKRDSVAVQVGQHVVAGQQIGQLGGSGGTPLPQLHFEVSYRDTPVEPFLAANDYFMSPRPYTLDAPRGLLDFGITNEVPIHEHVAERISDIDTFPVTSQRIRTYAWAVIASLHVGDTWKVKYIQPNGNVFSDAAPQVIQDAGAWQWYYWQTRLPISPMTGQWRSEWYINDQLVGMKFFNVAAAEPEIRVLREQALNPGGPDIGELLIDGRTTPIDFGTIDPGAAAPTQVFTVQNHGYADLVISGVELPAGYSIAEPLSATIAAGASDTFTVRLDSNAAGRKSGRVTIHSNDSSEPNSSFPVEGTVTGSLRGDYNSNGVVDAADYAAWRNTLGMAVPPESGADGDGDGMIDDGDYGVWRANFGRTAGAGALLQARGQNIAVEAFDLREMIAPSLTPKSSESAQRALPLVAAIPSQRPAAARRALAAKIVLGSASTWPMEAGVSRLRQFESMNLLSRPGNDVRQRRDIAAETARLPHDAGQRHDAFSGARDDAFHWMEVERQSMLATLRG